MKNYGILAASVVFFATGSVFSAKAEPIQSTLAVSDADLASLRSKSFDEQLIQQLTDLSKQRQAGKDSTALETRLNQLVFLIVDRLQKDIFVSDDVLISMIHIRIDFDRIKKNSFFETLPLIDSVLPLLHSRSIVESHFYTIKGNAYSEIQNPLKALENYEKAASLINSLRINVDIERAYATLKAADYALIVGDKAKAEKFYLEIYSYPWYQIKEDTAVSQLRECVVRAGLGLINARSGNLKALKEIYYYPALKSRLEPALQAAIQDAEKGHVFRSAQSKTP